MHCMIDIETLGTKADSVILTIGALRFDPNSMEDPTDGLHLYLEVDEQTAAGRSVSDDTVAWWAEQVEEVREDVFREDGRINTLSALDQLSEFVGDSEGVWAQGPTFDMIILEHLYESQGRKAPWRFHKVRDSRTLFSVLGDPRGQFPMAHNALVDCYYQAKGVQICMAQVRRAKESSWSGDVDRQGGSFTQDEYLARIGL